MFISNIFLEETNIFSCILAVLAAPMSRSRWNPGADCPPGPGRGRAVPAVSRCPFLPFLQRAGRGTSAEAPVGAQDVPVQGKASGDGR